MIFHRLANEISTPIATNTSLYPFYIVASEPSISSKFGSNTALRLTLGLSSDWNSEVGSADGVLDFPNSQKPLLSIPYRIRRGTNEDLNFVLVLKNGVSNKDANEAIEVQLFNSDRTLFYSKLARINGKTKGQQK